MQDNQRTLRKEYIFEGKGLHSGKKVKMTLSPAPTGSGIIFLREDLGPDAVMEAVADYVTTTQRGTTMEKGEIRVSTAEHLLSAFAGMGVDNALVRLNSLEVPILDERASVCQGFCGRRPAGAGCPPHLLFRQGKGNCRGPCLRGADYHSACGGFFRRPHHRFQLPCAGSTGNAL